ncbi:MAG: hemerythrin domain-containing protein [Kofleriaceae bacterium]|nr:hemerythrin domain-containing protein [Kofleriaceae bacterium]
MTDIDHRSGRLQHHNSSLQLTSRRHHDVPMTNVYQRFHRGLELIHEVLRRNVRHIHGRTDAGVLRDPAGFARYVHTYLRFLTYHHAGEDHFIFPAIRAESAGRSSDLVVLERLEREHRDLVGLMDEIAAELPALARGDEAARRAVAALSLSIRVMLDAHLGAEEASLIPAHLATLVSEAGLEKPFAAMQARDEREGGAAVLLLLMHSLTATERRELLGELPWFVRKVLVPGPFRWAHPAIVRHVPAPAPTRAPRDLVTT